MEGLSKERINKMAKVKGKVGYRKLKMIKTQSGAAMKQIKNEDVRKMIDYALGVQNKEKNVPILESLAKKKHELALILGYSSFSEFILEDRMAKTP